MATNLIPLLSLFALLHTTTLAAPLLKRQSGSDVDTDGGASGGSGGGSYVSQGGVIAIVVIVVIVVVLGIASTVLFVLAKRRQWDVRASIKRASRRLTGRGASGTATSSRPTAADRQSKRVGLQMGSMPKREGYAKQGAGVGVQEVEKGNINSTPKRPEGPSWLWRNDWKR